MLSDYEEMKRGQLVRNSGRKYKKKCMKSTGTKRVGGEVGEKKKETIEERKEQNKEYRAD